jgi:hypothetical protein
MAAQNRMTAVQTAKRSTSLKTIVMASKGGGGPKGLEPSP